MNFILVFPTLSYRNTHTQKKSKQLFFTTATVPKICEQLLTVNTFIDNCDLKVPKLPLLTYIVATLEKAEGLVKTLQVIRLECTRVLRSKPSHPRQMFTFGWRQRCLPGKRLGTRSWRCSWPAGVWPLATYRWTQWSCRRCTWGLCRACTVEKTSDFGFHNLILYLKWKYCKSKNVFKSIKCRSFSIYFVSLLIIIIIIWVT